MAIRLWWKKRCLKRAYLSWRSTFEATMALYDCGLDLAEEVSPTLRPKRLKWQRLFDECKVLEAA